MRIYTAADWICPGDLVRVVNLASLWENAESYEENRVIDILTRGTVLLALGCTTIENQPR